MKNFWGDKWENIAKKEQEIETLLKESEKVEAEVEGILKAYFENYNNVGEGNLKLKCVMKKVVTEKIERREEINKTIAKLRREICYLNQQIEVALRKHKKYSELLQKLK